MKRLALLALVAGCAGMKPYQSQEPRNVRVATQLESGVTATLRIYAVDGCKMLDLGGMPLDRATQDLGVIGPTLLVVTFDTSSFFRGKRNTSTELFFTPRGGARYELTAKYSDDIYDVVLRSGGRELPRRGLESCK